MRERALAACGAVECALHLSQRPDDDLCLSFLSRCVSLSFWTRISTQRQLKKWVKKKINSNVAAITTREEEEANRRSVSLPLPPYVHPLRPHHRTSTRRAPMCQWPSNRPWSIPYRLHRPLRPHPDRPTRVSHLDHSPLLISKVSSSNSQLNCHSPAGIGTYPSLLPFKDFPLTIQRAFQSHTRASSYSVRRRRRMFCCCCIYSLEGMKLKVTFTGVLLNTFKTHENKM